MLTPNFLNAPALSSPGSNSPTLHAQSDLPIPSPNSMMAEEDRTEATTETTVFVTSNPNTAERCQIASAYIQAVSSGKTGFLVTNIAPAGASQTITSNGTRWLVGRSQDCPIVIDNKTISRHHVEISYQPESGFSITDLGSNNGTRVNFRTLGAKRQHFLQDGDLIEIGRFQLEFFITAKDGSSDSLSSEMTRY